MNIKTGPLPVVMALAEKQRLNQIGIERPQDDLLKINLSNEVSFDFDSAQLKPAFLNTLGKVSDVLRRYEAHESDAYRAP